MRGPYEKIFVLTFKAHGQNAVVQLGQSLPGFALRITSKEKIKAILFPKGSNNLTEAYTDR